MYLNENDFILLTACCDFLILLRVFRETPEVGRGRARQGAWPPGAAGGTLPGARRPLPGAGGWARHAAAELVERSSVSLALGSRVRARTPAGAALRTPDELSREGDPEWGPLDASRE